MKVVKYILVSLLSMVLLAFMKLILFPYVDWNCSSSNTHTKSSLSALINNNLNIGDSRETVEKFLIEHNITYTYYRPGKRTQTALHTDCLLEPEGFRTLVMNIYFDDEGLFKDSRVKYAYK